MPTNDSDGLSCAFTRVVRRWRICACRREQVASARGGDLARDLHEQVRRCLELVPHARADDRLVVVHDERQALRLELRALAVEAVGGLDDAAHRLDRDRAAQREATRELQPGKHVLIGECEQLDRHVGVHVHRAAIQVLEHLAEHGWAHLAHIHDALGDRAATSLAPAPAAVRVAALPCVAALPLRHLRAQHRAQRLAPRFEDVRVRVDALVAHDEGHVGGRLVVEQRGDLHERLLVERQPLRDLAPGHRREGPPAHERAARARVAPVA
mmetsp:Transcript_10653/g.27659  ORF Transcript_10653/g.27659 Transcript_10653/m.27659 type:complete len:269 (-) Transcript_10653:1059-1865(-)